MMTDKQRNTEDSNSSEHQEEPPSQDTNTLRHIGEADTPGDLNTQFCNPPHSESASEDLDTYQSADAFPEDASPSHLPSDAAGERYVLHEEIARGGMGAVLKCHDQQLERDLAIKVLLPSHTASGEAIQRFMDEAQISGQLQHPSIVPVHDIGLLHDERPFFAMKLVKGETLKEMLSRRNDLSQDRSRFLGIFEHICQAMGYAHSRKVVHRDLKPSNVMVGSFGEVQVMDWGLAKVLTGQESEEKDKRPVDDATEVSVIRTLRNTGSGAHSDSATVHSETNMGEVLGTIAYMPPEQALGEVDRVDERADVFGLGAILCVILTGQPPYVAKTAQETLRLAMRGNLDHALSRLRQCDADSDLIDLARRCLAPEPEDRPRNGKIVADEMATYLESVADRLHRAELRQIEIQTRSIEERKRRRVQGMLAASVVLIVLLASGGLAFMMNRETEIARQEAKRQEELTRIETEAKQAALVASRREADLRIEAQKAKREVEITLADAYASRGLDAGDDGDEATAILWFAKSAGRAARDSGRASDNLRRARNWSRRTPTPVAAIRPRFAAEDIVFQPETGQHLLIQSFRDYLLWNWRTDELLPWFRGTEGIRVACWDPSGLSVAVAIPQGDVLIRSVPDGRVLQQITPPGAVTAMCYSPTGSHLAIAGDAVRVWSCSDSEYLDALWEHESSVGAMAFTQDATRLVTASEDKKARVFAVDDSSLDAPLFPPVPHLPYRPPSAPALINSDQGLVTITSNLELTWWKMHDGTVVRRIPAATMWGLSHVVASRHGDLLLTGGYYGPAIWQVNQIDAPATKLSHVNYVDYMSISRDGSLLITASWDTTSQVWSLPDGEPIGPRLLHNTGTHRVAFSDDNAFFATTQDNRLIRVWRMPIDDLVLAQDHWGDSPKLSPDGRLVSPGIWHESPGGIFQKDRSVSVRDVKTGRPLGPDITVEGRFVDSCICDNNALVATVSEHDAAGFAQVWDLQSGQENQKLPLACQPIGVSSHPKLPHAAVLCTNGELTVFHVRSGERIKTVPAAWRNETVPAPMTSFCQYSPDGKFLVVKAADHFAYVYDTSDYQLVYEPIQILLNGQDPCRSAAISTDSRILATGSKGAARIWDLATGKELCDPLVHPAETSGLTGIGLSADGNRVITANADRMARVWDWRKGELVCPPLRHSGAVFSAALTPDGQHAVTGSRGAEGGPHIWELRTGHKIAPSHKVSLQTGNVNGARDIQISPDGTRALASVEDTETLKIIDLGSLLSPVTESVHDYRLLGEVTTFHSLELNEPDALTIEDWEAKWAEIKTSKVIEIPGASTRDRIAQGLARIRAKRSLRQYSRSLEQLEKIQLLLDATDSEGQLNKEFQLVIGAEVLLERALAHRGLGDQQTADGELAQAIQMLSNLKPRPMDSHEVSGVAKLLTQKFSKVKDRNAPMFLMPGILHQLQLAAMPELAAGMLVAGDAKHATVLLRGLIDHQDMAPPEWLLLLAIAEKHLGDHEAASGHYAQAIAQIENKQPVAQRHGVTILAMHLVGGKSYREAASILQQWQLAYDHEPDQSTEQ